ncbi:MAG: formylmethanofuran dehydrogenase subunit A [Gemmataceae bacterium]
MSLRIAGGTIYDPVNALDGVVRDLWIRDGKIIAPFDEPPSRTIDATGLVVMPGGVDMHTHIAGPKINAARRLSPERRDSSPIRRTAITRSGTAGSVPSTYATGYLYAGLGYTTAVDPAITPLGARHAHLELADTPVVDSALLISLGDHHYALDRLAHGDYDRFRAFIGWVLRSTQGYGVKLVNPGGVETYKQGGSRCGLDETVPSFGVTPRQIIRIYAQAVDELGLPHAIHVHGADLGMPGNAPTTLATMQSLDGRRGHFTHIQFHSYGGDKDDPESLVSRASELAEYVNSHPEITVDVGQVMFGPTMTLTGDSALGHYLARATGRRYLDFDTECEGGCGISPIEYKDANFVNAMQWAIGLEWFLLVKDPWRVAMTTDHPSGGAFVAYPEIVQLLMSRDYRREILARLPPKVRERTVLTDLDREYTLSEIAIITRAGPARILGLPYKGHLGVGADADIAIYAPSADRKTMFTLPRFVLKAGEVIVENAEIRKTTFGQTLTAAPDHDSGFVPHLRDWFSLHHSIQFANFPIHDDFLEHGQVQVKCQPGNARFGTT